MTHSALLLAALALAGLHTQPAPKGVSNYTRIDATVACAGATTVDAIPKLKAEGFKTIVNLRLATESGADVEASSKAAAVAGLTYVHIPFSGADPRTEAVDQFLATVKDPRNSPVYIHCAGAGRAGMMWMIKRVMVDGWPVDKATEEAARIGMSSDRLKNFALDYLKAHGTA
jgi:uncharacterized protein (TIGR01244 family)